MRISRIAIKKPNGEIKTAPIGKRHDDLKTSGKRGFITDTGKFAGRQEAAKVANKAHQTKGVKSLHSHNLKPNTKVKPKGARA